MTEPAKEYRYADHAMQVWRVWATTTDEQGWPSKSSEAVAYERAKSATRTDGIARWRGTGAAPPMPKETRSRSASQIPIIDRARLGPWVHRHLLDLQDWRPEMAKVLRAHYLAQARDVPGRAELLGLKVREYYRLLHSGLVFLEGRLSLSPPDT